MRAIVFLLQLLFWLLVVRLLLRGLARFVGSGPAGGRQERSQAPHAIEDLVLYRVCRTYVPRSRAIAARVAGREELFCSAACRDKALAAVARAS